MHGVFRPPSRRIKAIVTDWRANKQISKHKHHLRGVLVLHQIIVTHLWTEPYSGLVAMHRQRLQERLFLLLIGSHPAAATFLELVAIQLLQFLPHGLLGFGDGEELLSCHGARW